MKSTSKPQLTPLQDLICGALAGMSARMVVAPLDVVKIRLQVQSETRGRYQYPSVFRALRTIVHKEGVSALWKGNVPAILMVAPYCSIQLATFYQVRLRTSEFIPEPFLSLSIGAISGGLATICTYPLDLLRTRFAAQPEPKIYRNLPHAVRLIVRHEGLRGLYRGLYPTVIEIIPYMAINFALYENLKHIALYRLQLSRLDPHHYLYIGATAGTISKIVTLPLDNVKKIMQVQAQFQRPQQQPYRGVLHVLQKLWVTDGLSAWFRGTTPSVLKAAPNSAITFAVYEATKSYFV